MTFKNNEEMVNHLRKSSPEDAKRVEETMEVIRLWRNLQEVTGEEREAIILRMKELGAI